MGMVYSLANNDELYKQAFDDALNTWLSYYADADVNIDTFKINSHIVSIFAKEDLLIIEELYNSKDVDINKFQKLVEKYKKELLFAEKENITKNKEHTQIHKRQSGRIKAVESDTVLKGDTLAELIDKEDAEKIINNNSIKEDNEYVADLPDAYTLPILMTAPSKINRTFKELNKEYGEPKHDEEEYEDDEKENMDFHVSKWQIFKDRLLAICGVDIAKNDKWHKISPINNLKDYGKVILKVVLIILCIFVGLATIGTLGTRISTHDPNEFNFIKTFKNCFVFVASEIFKWVFVLIKWILKNIILKWQILYILIINIVVHFYCKIKDNIDTYNAAFRFITPLPTWLLKILVGLGGLFGLDTYYCTVANNALYEEKDKLKTVPKYKPIGIIVDVLILITLFI